MCSFALSIVFETGQISWFHEEPVLADAEGTPHLLTAAKGLLTRSGC